MAKTTVCKRIFLSAFLCLSVGSASAQFISTNTPVPPLQWLNLSGLLQGTVSPPPLKDAAIGYDESSRSVIIFGGESAAGLVQSQTYLLNLDTLTWSTPKPPSTLQGTPSARSAAVFGVDFAASNRHGFVIIGGKGSDNTPLSDIWEYDFNNQFWSRVNVQGGPGARYAASGGIDASTPFSVDTSVPGPVNTFYLTGGADRTQTYPLSDVWRLNISGTLSSNLPDAATATWEKLSVGGTALTFDQASTVLGSKVVGTSGCNTTTSETLDCPQQDSFIVDTTTLKWVNPRPCPAPRSGAVLVRNYNPYTTTFTSQVFLLLGTVNHTKWDDGNGLDNGEVAILDTNTGSWSRILPSGDPTSSQKFPTPREGAVAVSFRTALVGASRNDSSDVLVFGGQDASGNLLSELWLLRGYKSSIDPSHPTWSGFGDGTLQSGINANGAGVNISYLQQCATAIATSPSNGTSPAPSPTTPPSPQSQFDTSTIHKVLSPLSLAVLQVAFVFIRLASPLYQNAHHPVHSTGYTYLGALLTLASVGLGIAGLATAFTSLSSKDPSPPSHLKTTHGITALVFFILPYALITLLCVTSCFHHTGSRSSRAPSSERVTSPDVTEKVVPDGSRSPSSIDNQPLPSPPSSPRRRTNSWGPSSWMYTNREVGSSESLPSENAAGVGASTGPKRGFEVLNRPAQRMRRNSTGWTAVSTMEALSDTTHSHANSAPPPLRSLQDIDWLKRRRSLNVVGELDYAITQAQRERMLSPATGDGLMLDPGAPSGPSLPFPPLPITLLHILVQAVLLGLSIITLIALWKRAPRAAFAVFLVWTVAIYTAMLASASQKQPNRSILTVVYSRFNSESLPAPISLTPLSPSGANSSPLPVTSPYTHHQPPYRRAATPFDAASHLSPMSVEEDLDDLDEDTRQRIMEEELGRRDVSIVTVPKRKLWITNPS